MPNPILKFSFESGDLSGFNAVGRCHAANVIATPNGNLHARSGLFFAVIDDPTMADDDGIRLSGPPLPMKTASYSKTASNGLLTFGVDGAMLELENITLQKNTLVRFWWAFFGQDKRLGCNDFALFEIVDRNDRPLHRIWLHETRIDTFKPWTVCQYDSEIEASVKLRWIASNGRTAIDSDEVEQSFHSAFPCTLLLDAIEII